MELADIILRKGFERRAGKVELTAGVGGDGDRIVVVIGKRRGETQAHGYKPDYIVATDTQAGLDAAMRVIRARGIEGVVIPHAPAEIRELAIRCEDLACAYIGQGIRKPHLSRVDSHHAYNMGLACQQLAAMGHRRIGFAGGRAINEKIREAWHGAYLAWAATTTGVKPLHSLFLNDEVMHRQQQLADLPEGVKWLQKEQPDAVISESNWLLQLIAKHSSEVRVCGLNLESDTLHAGIENRREAIGRAAFELVLAQLHRGERGVPPFAKHVMIEGVWRAEATSSA